MTIRKTTIAAACALTAAIAMPVFAAGINSGDRTFMQKAAQGGMAEIAAGKVAASQGTRDDVKKFGSQMVDDHGKAGDELSQIAAQKKVKLPDSPDGAHKAALEKMKKMQGSKFDDVYISDAGVKDHKAALKLFQDEAKNGKDPDVKAFAQKTVPTIQQHLTMVEGMAKTK